VGPEAHLKFSFPTKTHNGYEVHHKKQGTREAQPITVTKFITRSRKQGRLESLGRRAGCYAVAESLNTTLRKSTNQ
jgi:hypothetical protein